MPHDTLLFVGHDPATGTLLRVAGVRVLGLRQPVTLSVEGPNNPKPKTNPPAGPNPPHQGPPSQIAPSDQRQATRFVHVAPISAPQNKPPIEHGGPAPISLPQNAPEQLLLRGRGRAPVSALEEEESGSVYNPWRGW